MPDTILETGHVMANRKNKVPSLMKLTCWGKKIVTNK